MSNKAEGGGVVVGAVVNAVAILRRLAVQPEPAGVNAIARAVSVSPSSCFNILKTLVREDLVEFDPVSRTYSSGPGLAALLPQAADAQTAFARCAPLLQDVAERHGGTAALWRVAPSERLVLLGFAESASTTRIHMTVGQRLPVLAGAGGRCVAVMLGLSKAEIAERFRLARWASPPTPGAYQQQVASARAKGWALDDGEFLNGVTTLSVALADASGRPAYIVGITFFRGQHPPADLERIGAELKALTPRLAKALGLES